MNLANLMKRCLSITGFRVLCYSTQALASVSKDSLYRRISPVGDPTVSIVPILDQWIKDGNTVGKKELLQLIRQLRGFRRYSHALQMSEWMTCKRYFGLTPGDTAIRLDLIYKVYGIEHVEKYFRSIPKRTKTLETYGALVNCYAQEMSVEKVEALLKTMRELGFVTSLTYSALLNLYYKIGEYEKLDILIEEMKENGIRFDIFAYKIRISAYIAASDITGMESLLKTMEDDQNIAMDWDAYSVVAHGYIKSGLTDKAVEMLEKLEALVSPYDHGAYRFLLTLHASIGRKDDVYRIWGLLKKSSKYISNDSYISMLSSLSRLGDIEGAENVIREWESSCFCYDFRVPNQLIVAYCKKGLFEKAESFVNEAIGRGKTPYPSTWESMALGYLSNDLISKAVEKMKAALLANRTGWAPSPALLAACLEFFEKQGNVEGMEDFIKLVRQKMTLTRDLYHIILRTYIFAGESVSDVVKRMKEDGVDPDAETEEILNSMQSENN